MIAFDQVVIRHPKAATPAVQQVSLQAPRGQLTALVGPNGSGKSTLVRALLGRVPCEAGTITLDGVSLAALDRKAIARRVAIVPQRESPAFPLTVREFVVLGRYAHAGTSSTVPVDAALARAGVLSLVDRTTDTLSGGEWQRVRIARALAQDAPALVFDEPTTFLDIAHEMAVFELLRALADDGHAVLLVSHQLNLVARFADRVVLLHHGQVAADGPPAHVMDGPTLERVYEWPLVVTRDPAVGAPALLPLRVPNRRPPRG